MKILANISASLLYQENNIPLFYSGSRKCISLCGIKCTSSSLDFLHLLHTIIQLHDINQNEKNAKCTVHNTYPGYGNLNERKQKSLHQNHQNRFIREMSTAYGWRLRIRAVNTIDIHGINSNIGVTICS